MAVDLWEGSHTWWKPRRLGSPHSFTQLFGNHEPDDKSVTKLNYRSIAALLASHPSWKLVDYKFRIVWAKILGKIETF